MGAQQSSSGGDAGTSDANGTRAPKTCYYELLGVERSATEDEIKKAYRRKALELHPDRNLNDVESATRRFAEIQSAHEILSDPQERAWYDSHRDAILSGHDDIGSGVDPTTFRNVRLTSTEEIMSLMRRFNATIPFNDEPNGFYGIARETFEHLALEEEAAAEFANVDAFDWPTFGSSDDDYETVVKPFYSMWAGFATMKSFSWKDKYRLSDAPDRRIRRLMEKDNKKLREDAARDFSDAVRFLVTFVRKRDPRYIPNTQTDAQRQQAIRDAAVKQAARSRAANLKEAEKFELPDWVQQESTAPSEAFSFDEGDPSEPEVEILECMVCDKTFKSEKQLEAHERSKKHQKAVQQLRRHMKKEGKELDLDSIVTRPAKKQEESEQEKDTDGDNESVVMDEEAAEPAASVLQDASSNDDAAEASQQPSTQQSSDGLSDFDEPGKSTDAPRPEVEVPPVVEAGDVPAKKMGKAKAKREKKLAKQAAEHYKCTMCYHTFASRTKLFDHIRAEGHAAAVPQQGQSSNKQKR